MALSDLDKAAAAYLANHARAVFASYPVAPGDRMEVLALMCARIVCEGDVTTTEAAALAATLKTALDNDVATMARPEV